MLKWRRLLYIVCFACIMLIDWSRGGARWVYWATFINLVGVVMSIVMASYFSWKKQPWAKYGIWFGIWLLGSVAGYFIWRNNPGDVFLSQYIAAAISIFTLGVVALRIWIERDKLQNANLGKPILVAIWVVMSVLMSCSRLGEIWQLYYLLIFGMFYLIPYNKEEREELWIGLADGCILGFFIIQIWAYGFRPYEDVSIRYKGAYSNTNMNALFYLVTYIMVLYRIHYMYHLEENKRVHRKGLFVLAKFVFVVLAAGLCNFILITMTRIAVLMAAVIAVGFVVYEFFIYRKVLLRKVLVRCAVFSLCAVFTFPCVYLTIRYLPTILHHPVWWEGEYSTHRVHSYDSPNSWKYVSFEELIEELLLRYLKMDVDLKIAEIPTQAGEVLPGNVATVSSPVINSGSYVVAATVNTEDDLLTGPERFSSTHMRLAIYKKYLSNLNLTGHELEEGYFRITKGYRAWHAQNVFIQVLFYYGVPAGILFIVLIAALAIGALRLVMRKKHPEDILVVLVGLVFVGYGMMECVWYMGQSILFLMYMIPKILIDARTEDAMLTKE